MEFTERFGEEDIDGVMDMFADSALWVLPSIIPMSGYQKII